MTLKIRRPISSASKITNGQLEWVGDLHELEM